MWFTATGWRVQCTHVIIHPNGLYGLRSLTQGHLYHKRHKKREQPSSRARTQAQAQAQAQAHATLNRVSIENGRLGKTALAVRVIRALLPDT